MRHVSTQGAAEGPRQPVGVLGAGGELPHAARLTAENGGLSGQADPPGTERLAEAVAESQWRRRAAADAVRLVRGFAGAGLSLGGPEGSAGRASASVRGRVPGVDDLADAGSGQAAGRADGGGP